MTDHADLVARLRAHKVAAEKAAGAGNDLLGDLIADLGEAAAGPETYPGHDPAAGLPKPDTAGGAVIADTAKPNLTREEHLIWLLGDLMDAVENYFGAPNPKRSGHIYSSAARIVDEVIVPMRTACHAEATAAERERCAEIVEAYPKLWDEPEPDHGAAGIRRLACAEIVAAIRGGGNG